MSGVKIVPRRSQERGHANHGWLNTHHTFSFAHYYDFEFSGFGALRVINEDFVEANNGFGTHSHMEYEIFSYIIDGELEHKDSMKNVETLCRGDVQFTTAGTGISHSEFNRHPTKRNHFLQIWVKPDNPRLDPAYDTRTFPDSVKQNALASIISPAANQKENTIGIHTDFHMNAALLDSGNEVVYRVERGQETGTEDKDRRLYVHLAMTGGELSINVQGNEQVLKEGDGAFITGVKGGDEVVFKSVGEKQAEFVLFDLA